MRKILVLAVLGGTAVFAAVSLANSGSGGAIRVQVPGEVKTLDAHRVSPSGKDSKLGLVYVFADVTIAPRETGGGAVKCPKKWHPVSGLFTSDSDVVLASDAPISERKWAVFVLNQSSNAEATVTIGAVCVKGLPIPPPPG